MKKIFFALCALMMVALTVSATDLTGKRIYVNPGHGSFGPNDRPMATIPYPNLASTGMPDTCGFYESNTDLWKCQYLRDRLVQAGATVVMSRNANGPWPYEKVNGEYPSYTYDDYRNRPDYEAYNRNLSEICEEVEAGNFDYFISVHSNAATDGSTTNYPLALYRGFDNATVAHDVESKASMATTWPYRYEMFAAGFDYASAYTNGSQNVRGDCDFYGSYSTSTRSNGQSYTGYLGVLKHGTIGGLWEGYFHTYQPARHRALNHDYCAIEGYSYYRGIIDYFHADTDPLGYICGTVKDMDNKMVHGLYKYAPKTSDQWVPCNGATVYLLNAAGDTLQNYQVDDLYNGIFAFYNLQPGTYHLFATCPGYYDLDAEQAQADVVVTANTVTYPFIQLRDTSWAPAPIVYETYPDRSAGVTGMDGKYNFGAAQAIDFSAAIPAGKVVRQVLVRDDNETYVLALDTAARKSSIYKIHTLTGAVLDTVSTVGTQGDYYPVYNIAFTADSILVGGNFGENQYDAAQVAGGNTHVRGTFRTYYWNMADLHAAPTQWFTSLWSGNFYNANVGESFAVSGPFATATVYSDAKTISGVKIRVAQFSTEAGQLVATVRNQSADNAVSTATFGFYQAIASPNADDRAIMAGSIASMEYGFNADAQAPNVAFNMPALYGGQAFKYGGKSIVAAPVVAQGVITGINLYNCTLGMRNYAEAATNIQPGITSDYYSVKPLAQGKEIVLYLATADHIYRYTTVGQTQPQFTNIYAYNLEMAMLEDAYQLTFDLNTEATAAEVILTNIEDGSVLATYPVAAPVLTGNTINIPFTDVPDSISYNWSVKATAPVVGNWSVAKNFSATSLGATRLFNAVNIYPETDHFGTIYMMNRGGAGAASNGMLVMNPDYTMAVSTPAQGGQAYSSPYRFGIASDGSVFVGDWGDPHSGVYYVNPADPTAAHTAFFAGTQNSAGLWKNGGVEEGSSTPSVYVYGTGADTKLLVYNEDPGTTLPTNGLCVYNIGQPDGSILHHWDGAPSAKMDFAGQANTNGNVWGCSKGVWVSQHRSAGNNNSSATSLRFYTWDGECTYSSHLAPVDALEQLVIEGSLGSCFALTPDEKTLVLNGVDKDFLIFDVAWNGNTPTLTLKATYKHGYAGDFDFLQMNFDYAGNLVVSGNAGLLVFAMPKDENVCVTPAKSTQILGKQPEKPMLNNPIGADGRFIVKYDCENNCFAAANDMEIGETFTMAIDLTGTWLADYINADPTRGLAINKWTSRGDVNINVARFRRIEGDIWGMTVNFSQHVSGDWITGALLADSTTTVYAHLFAFDTNGAWWQWDGHDEVTTQAPGADGLFQFAPSTGKQDEAFTTSDMEGEMYGYNIAGYAAPCATRLPVEINYFIKHPWGTGADADWTWQQMADTTFQGIEASYYVGQWGGIGFNINTKADNEGAEWYEADIITYLDKDGVILPTRPANGTVVTFIYLHEDFQHVVGGGRAWVICDGGTALDNINAEQDVEKFYRDGQILIRKGEHIYTTTGQLVE